MDRRTRMWPFRRPVTRYFDPLLRPVAGRLPAFGIVSHRGRKTGKVYETPVNVFMRDGDYVFFLTYGSDVHWVKNILASGSCVLRTRGRDVRLVEPELIADPQLLLAPRFVRFVEKRLAGVTEVLRMRPAAALPIDVHELRRDELPIVSEALTNRSARTHRARLELQERGRSRTSSRGTRADRSVTSGSSGGTIVDLSASPSTEPSARSCTTWRCCRDIAIGGSAER